MNLIFIFLAASVLFSATAFPTQPSQGSSSGPNPNYVPKIGFRPDYWLMTKNDRDAAKDMIINHYKALEPGNEQKKARLAFAPHHWRDGIRSEDEHRQYLDFNYHQGEHQDSAKIGQPVTIARDRPPPEPHIANGIPKENKPEIASEMNKKYRNLPPDQAKRVRSMKVDKDWGEGDGFREETQMTFHHGARPKPSNIIGGPATIYRPMSFQIDDTVPEKQIPVIKSRIRQEHNKLDENHPLKQANYAVVTEGWHKLERLKAMHVEATMFRMKDELSDNDDGGYERMGELRVPLGRGQHMEAQSAGTSTNSKRKRD